MATLIELCKGNQLVRVDPQLGGLAMEKRFIYLLPGAAKWFKDELPMAESTWDIEESPMEQVDALMAIFCSGEPLIIGDRFKHLLFRDTEGIWELKTADVRMFGWFPQKDHFVISDCNNAGFIKQNDLYHGYSTQTHRHRKLLDLDEPKFVAGGEPNDVVSNWATR